MDKSKGEVIIKLVNASSEPVSYNLVISGRQVTGAGSMQVISSTQPYAYNSLDQQKVIYPKKIRL